MDIRPHRRIFLPLNDITLFDVVELASDMHEHIGGFKVCWELFSSSGSSISALGVELGLNIIFDIDVDIDLKDSHAIIETLNNERNAQFIVRYGSSPAMESIINTVGNRETPVLVNLTTINSGVELAASFAHEAGFRAFLCRAQDVKSVRDKLGPDISIMATDVNGQPGTTPVEVMEAGASFIIVDDLITMSKDQVKAARTMAEDIRPFT